MTSTMAQAAERHTDLRHTPRVAATSHAYRDRRPVTGRLSDGSTFMGAIRGLQTTVVNGGLALSARISGAGVVPAAGQLITQTLNLDQLRVNDASTVLTVRLAPVYLDAFAMIVYLRPVDLWLPAGSRTTDLPGAMLRRVGGLLERGGPADGVSVLVNLIVSELGLGL